MGDFYSGTIRIPTHLINQDVIDSLSNEGLITVIDDEEEMYGEQENGISSYTMSEARDGEFFGLQVDLERWGIPYDVQSEGYHDSLPQIKYFRPENTDSSHDTVILDQNAQLTIPADVILDLYEKVCLESVSRDDVRLILKEHLEEHAGLKFRPLASYVPPKGE